MKDQPASRHSRLLVPPPVQALCWALAMWAIASTWPAPVIRLPGQAVVALGLAGVGLAIDLASVVRFLRSRTTVNPIRPDKATSLVISGLYRYSRNPMYLGMLLVLSGWAVWLGHVIAFAGPVLFAIVLTRIQILPEETALEARFGQEYLDYKARVRRWI